MARQRGEPAATLDLLEPAWAGHLRGGGLAASLDLEEELVLAVARLLGAAARTQTIDGLARSRPACLVVALSAVAARGCRDGDFWPSWQRASGRRLSRSARQVWGVAFLDALRLLGRPLPVGPEQAVLVHAGMRGVAPATGTGECVDPEAELLLRHADSIGRELAEHSPRALDAFARGDRDAALRIEPYGAGVLRAAGPEQGGEWHPVTPDQIAPDGGLLLFDEDGLILPGAPPAALVWALRPAGWELRGDVPVRTVVESTLPLPWRGWRLTQVALDGVSRLVAGTEQRRVAGRSRPRLLTGPSLPGLTTTEGRAVRPSLPRLRLPAGEGDWRVEVRRGAGGPLLARARGAAGDWDDERLWYRLPRPFLGELLITATPLTATRVRGLRRGVFVAEGLHVRYRPALRLPADEGGLEPVEALLAAAPGTTAAPTAVSLGSERVSAEVQLVAGPVVHGLRVVPPRLRVRVEPEPGTGGRPSAWHGNGAPALGLPELRRGGALRLDLPGTEAAPPLEVVADRCVVQRLEPSSSGRYPLRRLLDTAAAHGSLALRITVDGRIATVARVLAEASQQDPWLPDQRPPADGRPLP